MPLDYFHVSNMLAQWAEWADLTPENDTRYNIVKGVNKWSGNLTHHNKPGKPINDIYRVSGGVRLSYCISLRQHIK
jgi:hypothetical protein